MVALTVSLSKLCAIPVLRRASLWSNSSVVEFEPTPITLPNSPVPLFPLPGVFLFPHQVLPLHIFEERYRTMVAELLDGPGRFVIASPLIGGNTEPGQPTSVIPVGGLGEILRHEKLDDGRYMIWVLGLSRVHIEEVDCETPYRQVECLPFMETVVPDAKATDLIRELRDAASSRLKEPLPLPDSTPPGLLADLLMQTLQAERSLVERAFIEPDVLRRAQLALKEAERRADREEDRPSESGGEERAEGLIEFMENMFDGLDFGPLADDIEDEPEGRPDD